MRGIEKQCLLNRIVLSAALALAFPLPASADQSMPAAAARSSSSTAFRALLTEHWNWWLSLHPFEATAQGVRDYDAEVPDYSLKARDREAAEANALLLRLNEIPAAGLTQAEQVDKAVLAWTLSAMVEANRYGQRAVLFTSYYSWWQGFADQADQLPFYNKADYESYLTRLSLYPRINGQAMAVTARALAEGFVQPCSALDGLALSVKGTVTGDARDLRFFAPFKRNRPSDVTAAEWSAMQARAAAIIDTKIRGEYMRLHDWLLASYIPKCRKTDSASQMPQGPAWYASRVRAHTTTSLTAAQIHQIGLDELARIAGRMDRLAAEAGFATRQAFIAKIKSDPAYRANSKQAMLAAAALEAKKHDGLLPRYFNMLPRLPYGVRPVPDEIAPSTTAAYYMPGSPKSGISGTFYVNTSKLDERPLWELPALTAHEAVPGHHNQIARQQELDLPEFRKHGIDFTGYVEGWGLYSEYLGEEMGFYDTPEKMMGRLSFDAWRALRLIVDTGIHAKGWDKARAVAFMKANSALSDANIDAEVNRYISWPGQALGYKIGEIRIRELRIRAETELGPRFDLRAFHDVLLGTGAVPLEVLSQEVNRWIAQQAKEPAS